MYIYIYIYMQHIRNPHAASVAFQEQMKREQQSFDPVCVSVLHLSNSGTVLAILDFHDTVRSYKCDR